jgi:hypothetical protein
LTGRLTKPMGGVLVAAYLVFLYIGLIQ